MNEEALLLGPNKSLVGIYTPSTSPKPLRTKVAAVILNAGLVHHAGPHRLHVKLARKLAAAGISALRVDFSGIGDSSVRSDDIPGQRAAVVEQKEILDDLEHRGYDNFVLFGICSGAKNALQAVAEDSRIKGVVLVNPAATEEDPQLASLVSAQFYMRRSLWNLRAWRNLLSGRVNYKAMFATILGLVKRRLPSGGEGTKNTALSDIFRREIEPALDQGAKVLLLLSDRHAQIMDLVGDGLKDLQTGGRLCIETLSEADHLFTVLQHQELLLDWVCRWVGGFKEEVVPMGKTA